MNYLNKLCHPERRKPFACEWFLSQRIPCFLNPANAVSGNSLHAFVLKYPYTPISLQSCKGSFDCAEALLRKVPTLLKMTVQFTMTSLSLSPEYLAFDISPHPH